MKLLTSLTIAVTTLATVASALPSPSYGYGGGGRERGGRRGRRRDDSKDLSDAIKAIATCNTKNLTKLKLPAAASGYSSTWTEPDASIKLSRIVIGSGTQNYTCATPYSSAATPVANGAKADLYDFTCLAAALPKSVFDSYFHQLPLYYYDATTTPALPQWLTSVGQYNGQHIFSPDASTPVFTLDSPSGVFTGKKLQDTPAPTDAEQGVWGTVAWLSLGKKVETSIEPYEHVYRVVTAGGKAPPNCEGQEATFEVKYATEYWFYVAA